MKRFIITEDEKRQIRKMYLLESIENVKGNNLGVTKEKKDIIDGIGFWEIRGNSNILSVINQYNQPNEDKSVKMLYSLNNQVPIGSVPVTYSLQTTNSKINPLDNNEPQEGNTIGATYWRINKPNDRFSIKITGQNVMSEIDYTTNDEGWTGYKFNFINLPVGEFKIKVSDDDINLLTVTVSDCMVDEEWKKLYNILEDSAGQVDSVPNIRPSYCRSKNMETTIKSNFPGIDAIKIKCLINKVNTQYCKK